MELMNVARQHDDFLFPSLAPRPSVGELCDRPTARSDTPMLLKAGEEVTISRLESCHLQLRIHSFIFMPRDYRECQTEV